MLTCGVVLLHAPRPLPRPGSAIRPLRALWPLLHPGCAMRLLRALRLLPRLGFALRPVCTLAVHLVLLKRHGHNLGVGATARLLVPAPCGPGTRHPVHASATAIPVLVRPLQRRATSGASACWPPPEQHGGDTPVPAQLHRCRRRRQDTHTHGTPLHDSVSADRTTNCQHRGCQASTPAAAATFRPSARAALSGSLRTVQLLPSAYALPPPSPVSPYRNPTGLSSRSSWLQPGEQG
ncbi:hypothetical protein PLICRDRAFT_181187 [Plicaturopsis crispa FD-325 SS-3]|uniref:Uncharacterized protein n=1 Tax=Plicaturopsis crispa FD-325 SS-3 TaxID=944288 RepID=A0A0C9SPI5_PLICR|nr:hypothetical protein PLICRDRAFT_181187 [Plicaturopsis crispa FD-325 SS-3]